jgi:subtilase family serine protease
MGKLKTALLGAAIVACVVSPAVAASTAARIGNVSLVGAAVDTQPVTFDVMLPLHNVDKLEALVNSQTDPTSAQYHKWLTPAQFGAQFGPSAATKNSVVSYLKSQGFNVVKVETRSIRVQGSAGLVRQNFGVHLSIAMSAAKESHIVTNDSFVMAGPLKAAGAKVFSFSPHAFQVFSQNTGKLSVGKTRTATSGSGTKVLKGYSSNSASTSSDNRYSATGTYWFDDLKQAYAYPSVTDTVSVGGGAPQPLNGQGAFIAALMSSDIYAGDINDMFTHENWDTVTGASSPPDIGEVIFIDGGPTSFPNGATDEAALDTQMEIGGAPGAFTELLAIPDLYDGSILAGYIDNDEFEFAEVVSASFGQCELDYFPRYNFGEDFRDVLQAYHETFLQGNSEGITFLASSGDEAGKICLNVAAALGETDTGFMQAGVSVPASDPNVTAVGGTNLVTVFDEGSLNSAYAGENAWADTWSAYGPAVTGGYWGAGGGYSSMWAAPSYQSLVTTGSTARAVPDIGMQVGGCPFGATDYHPAKNECYVNSPGDGNGNSQRSAVAVFIGGGAYGLIGTSVSSPEFASVVAHLIELNGPMGNLNPYIYQLAHRQAAGTGRQVYNVNIPGFNGVTNTDLNSTYSLSVGVGTPLASSFVGKPSVAKAGIPQTTSNP